MPSADKYTDPELRDQVKKEIQESDKGGAPGQWSARKAQFMAQEYKKRGGGYNDDGNKDESQKNLSKWGEEWQTKEGSANAKQADGSRKRYLPKKAWENMSEEEKKKTDVQKQKQSKQSKQGKQFVPNTDKAKQSRKDVSEGKNDQEDGNDDDEQNEDDDGGEEEEEEEAQAGDKRGKGSKQQQQPQQQQKKQKTRK
ncbi:hypothetical protein NDA16_001016 [Ustilago loliicola]|nr:hypothetical protein NDA16_001016 [Ustilago loliicola]